MSSKTHDAIQFSRVLQEELFDRDLRMTRALSQSATADTVAKAPQHSDSQASERLPSVITVMALLLMISGPAAIYYAMVAPWA